MMCTRTNDSVGWYPRMVFLKESICLFTICVRCGDCNSGSANNAMHVEIAGTLSQTFPNKKEASAQRPTHIFQLKPFKTLHSWGNRSPLFAKNHLIFNLQWLTTAICNTSFTCSLSKPKVMQLELKLCTTKFIGCLNVLVCLTGLNIVSFFTSL